ncbi:MAG TPA: nucleotidyltransferase domain-containing protein [Dehalococcoidia bacterium]|nr:nucleotidyltransferase domain-containing protein [Dehalococcoidia bacterium]
MTNAASFVSARDAVIARLTAVANDDDRIAACWLQGSLADGTADALSDIDAYLSVPDEQFDAVFAARHTLVERLGEVLFFADGLIPGLHAVNAILAGPAKLDLFFERASLCAEVQRPALLLLVDKAGLAASLTSGWEPPLARVAGMVRTTFNGTRQGGLWPMRLLLRGQWAMFASVELRFINENLAMMMAVQHYPRLLFKNPFTMTRLLPPEQQATLEALSAAVMDGVVRRDLAALRDLHIRAYDLFVQEGKAALASLGLPYPGTEAGDAGQRAMYARQWPTDIPPK